MTAPALRRATPADAPAILAMSIELYALEHRAYDPATARAALDRLLAEPPLGFAIVVEDPSGALAGYAICTLGFDLEFGGHDAFLTEVFVADEARGQGLGRALLDAVLAEARASEIAAVHLLVRPDNPRAIELYESRGFVRDDAVVLTKRLTPGRLDRPGT